MFPNELMNSRVILCEYLYVFFHTLACTSNANLADDPNSDQNVKELIRRIELLYQPENKKNPTSDLLDFDAKLKQYLTEMGLSNNEISDVSSLSELSSLTENFS